MVFGVCCQGYRETLEDCRWGRDERSEMVSLSVWGVVFEGRPVWKQVSQEPVLRDQEKQGWLRGRRWHRDTEK